jgi:mono/diheme cytochrome c family protein
VRRGHWAIALAAWAVTPFGVHATPPPSEDFALQCSGCHGPNGAGTPGVVPPLSGLAPLLETPAGRAYLVRVPGVAQASLDDARLAALLNWVLAEFSGATPGPAYTGDEVGALRRHPLRDPLTARDAVLRRSD